MYWANFLHIYQPPIQTDEILRKVAQESYRKILAGLLIHPQAKLTLNMNGCLTEMLVAAGYDDIIRDIKTLLGRGQIELTGTAKYHAFLPKLPDDQIIRQIELNTETQKKYFGDLYEPKGFFPPEMGYDNRVGEIVQKLGYSWVILDELASPIALNPTKTYQNRMGMGYFFRERDASFKILTAQLGTAESMLQAFGERVQENQYMLTAMDGETFGHHRVGLEQLLIEMYRSPHMPTVLVSDLLTLFPEKIILEPIDSSWALQPKDILKNIPFARWDDPENPIHQLQWELTYLALKLVKQEGPAEQKLVDAALYSDQYWWASAKPWWSLEMIERGAYELTTAIQSFSHVSAADQQKAEAVYLAIIKTGFAWQRDGTVARLSKAKQDDEQTDFTGEMRVNQ